MKRTRNIDQWSRRRTDALLSLLKTPAPPDFQSQVLLRVRELAQASLTPQAAGEKRSGSWQSVYTWLKATLQARPMALATVAGSMSVFLLSAGLVWWFSGPPRGDLAPVAAVSLPVSAPQADDHATGQAQGDDGQRPVSPSEPIDLLASTTARQLANEQDTPDIAVAREQTVFPATPPPSLQNTSERSGATPAQPQRSGRKRGSLGKSKRVKEGQGPRKHPSA